MAKICGTCYVPGTVLGTSRAISLNPHRKPIRVLSPFYKVIQTVDLPACKPGALAPEPELLTTATLELDCGLLAWLPALAAS